MLSSFSSVAAGAAVAVMELMLEVAAVLAAS
jgi:hypothetical protein